MDIRIIAKKLLNYYTIEITIVVIWSVLTSFISTQLMKYWGFEVWKTHTSVLSLIESAGLLGAFWLTVIKMPFIEEMAFRLFLNLKWQNIAISIFFMLYLNLGIFFSNVDILSRFIISLVVFTLSFFILSQNRTFFSLRISEKQQKIIQIVSILIFGLYHITNFTPININFLLVYPFYTIPQIVAGYYLTKIRMEFGILWSIIYHIFSNLIPFMLQVIFFL